jgi:iron-sulfur cluster assembly protein
MAGSGIYPFRECFVTLPLMETISTAPVSFTEGALREIRRLQEMDSANAGKLLRVGVKGGGCSGLSYVLGFDDKQDTDELYEYKGLRFIMNPAHGIYLMGMEIDWQDGLNARGFTFNNPNASKSCGCGSSFAV